MKIPSDSKVSPIDEAEICFNLDKLLFFERVYLAAKYIKPIS